MRSSHEKAEAGSGPSWTSVPVPANGSAWPTDHVTAAVGAVIVATGAVLPTEMSTVTSSERPAGSVTRNLTVTLPAAVYVRCGVAEVESSRAPSPSRSQA